MAKRLALVGPLMHREVNARWQARFTFMPERCQVTKAVRGKLVMRDRMLPAQILRRNVNTPSRAVYELPFTQREHAIH